MENNTGFKFWQKLIMYENIAKIHVADNCSEENVSYSLNVSLCIMFRKYMKRMFIPAEKWINQL